MANVLSNVKNIANFKKIYIYIFFLLLFKLAYNYGFKLNSKRLLSQ